jgi:hypothetical protein
LQGALPPVRREVHPRCDPRRLRAFHPEVRKIMFLRNVGSYKKNVASSQAKLILDRRSAGKSLLLSSFNLGPAPILLSAELLLRDTLSDESMGQ